MWDNTSFLEEFCFNETLEATKSHIMLPERFVYAGVIGFVISLVGIICNTALVAIVFNRGSTVFVKALALCDIGMCLAYVFVISVVLSAERFGDMNLLYISNRITMQPMFCFGNFVKTGQLYVIICASVDRYIAVRVQTGKRSKFAVPRCSNRTRLTAVCTVLALAFIEKVPTFFEIAVVKNDQCTGFAYIYLTGGNIFSIGAYMYYKQYVLPVLQVYSPFITLIILNILIMRAMRTTSHNDAAMALVDVSKNSSFRKSQMVDQKRRIREATYTLIIITSGYLISNFIHVGLSLIEQTNRAWLDRHYIFYTVSSDIASILVILVSASRPTIYYFCNSELRGYFQDAFVKCKRKNGVLLTFDTDGSPLKDKTVIVTVRDPDMSSITMFSTPANYV